MLSAMLRALSDSILSVNICSTKILYVIIQHACDEKNSNDRCLAVIGVIIFCEFLRVLQNCSTVSPVFCFLEKKT